MTGLIQLRTLLHLARKHAWLLAVLAALPLAAAAWYARGQQPVYRASATVQIKPRPAIWFGSNEIWVDEDRMFIPDQIFRIKGDRALAGAVMADLRAWAKQDALPESFRGACTREEFASAVAALDAKGGAGPVSIEAVPETSYYRIQVPGASPALITAMANAYAHEIVAVLREEGTRSVDSQLDGRERDLEVRRDVARGRLEDCGKEYSRLREENPGVDLLRRVNLPQQALDGVRQTLGEVRERSVALQDQRRTVEAALRTAGLDLAWVPVGEGRAWRLSPALKPEAAEDPRLSPFVLALPAVAGDAGVRSALDRIASLRDLDLSLAAGPAALREGVGERGLIRQRIARAEGDLARSAEAAIANLAVEGDGAAARVGRLEARVGALEADAALHAGVLAKADEIQRKIDDQRREMDSLDGRLDESSRARKSATEAGAGTRNSVSLVQEATVGAVMQIAPDHLRIWSWAAIAALALAAGTLWLLQQFDDTVKSREDYDRLVRGLAFLGVVPAMEDENAEVAGIASVRGRTGTPVVESIRALRTTLHHAGAEGRELKTVLLTSSGPREGKSTLSANLAASFAQGGLRTLLVDGDLRRPRVHRMAGVANDRGLSTVLAGRSTLAECVLPCGLVEGMDVLTSGPLPPNPAELLGGPAMRALLAEAAGKYDRIVLDSPPIVTVTDPCILAPLVDAVLLVIAHGSTSARLIRRAREAMDAVGARVSGAVVNNAAPRRGFYGDPYYGYDYRYGYSAAPEGGNGSKGGNGSRGIGSKN